MQVYLGSDHGGQQLKERLQEVLTKKGVSVTDYGAHTIDPGDDYPQFAKAVAEAVVANPGSRGVLFCRSGEGMEMAANKVPGIRAALVWKPEVAVETRRDNDANVLVLPSDFVSDEDAAQIVDSFLETEFSGEERHVRRLNQLEELEKTDHGS